MSKPLWQPIETAPKDKRILILFKKEHVDRAVPHRIMISKWSDTGCPDEWIEGWMPLPELLEATE